MLNYLTLEDGRCLAYAEYGAPRDAPASRLALYFHGVPSCHMEAHALDAAAKKLGLAVVSMDRAGVGSSDYKCGRSLQTTADDAHQLARHLSMRRIVVIGTSGGGPYAAAFAALFPDLVDALVLVSAVGPTDWGNLPLLRAMHGTDLLQFGLALLPPIGGLWALHGIMGYMAKSHVDVLLRHAPDGMAAADGNALRSDALLQEGFGRCLQHAYSRGARGMAQDVRVLAGRWRLDCSRIKCRVMIWQGGDDLSVPVEHARWWAGSLPGSQLNVLPGEGHVTVLLHHGERILKAALEWEPDQGAAQH